MPEVMVSLLILGLMFSVMTAALSQASLLTRRSVIDQSQERERRVAETVKSLIENADLQFALNDDVERVLAFSGETNRVRFVGQPPNPAMPQGAYDLIIESAPSGETLLQFRPFLSDFPADGPDTFQRFIMLEAGPVFEFQYGARRDNGSLLWLDEWPFDNVLPQYVRISVNELDGTAEERQNLVRVHKSRHDLSLNSEDQFQ
ncbi:MAG: hypothetical protein AAGL99_18130 [Pseudomonadota bacterium]